jgi:hypothetical protein
MWVLLCASLVLGGGVASAQRLNIEPTDPPAEYHTLGGTGIHFEVTGTDTRPGEFRTRLESSAPDWLVPHTIRLALWVPDRNRFEIVWDSGYDPATDIMSGTVTKDGTYTVVGLSRASFVYDAQKRLHELLERDLELPPGLSGFGNRLCQRILCPAINYSAWTDEWTDALDRNVTAPELQGHFGGICRTCWSIDTTPLVLPEGPIIERVSIGPPDVILHPLSCPDTDEDTLYDCHERCIGSDPDTADSDGDGLNDGFEFSLGTELENWDSDGDAVGDHDEVFVHHTSPLNADTDGDGLGDGTEVALQTDPRHVDSDRDGLNDKWEVDDPVGLGVDPRRKDLIVEVDWMCRDVNDPPNGACDAGEKKYRPSISAQNAVKTVFSGGPAVGNPDGTNGINLILVVDPNGIPISPPAFDDVSNPLYEMDAEGNVSFTQAYYDLKNTHRDPALEGVSRYCLFIDEFAGDTSGMSEEIPSDDFVVALRHASVDGGQPAEQAGAFLHELGHSLGLYHGGSQGDGCNPRNYEPNYPSVMNYWHMYLGAQGSWHYGDPPNPPNPTWCKPKNTRGHLCFKSSASLATPTQSFSSGILADVDENNLDETVGFASIQPQDLDFDGVINNRVATDVQGDGCKERLDDFDDWNHFIFKVW